MPVIPSNKWRIRAARADDLDALLALYEQARDFMRANGNPHQWGDARPARAQVERDVADGGGFVCVDEDGAILAAFHFHVGDEETYHVIEEGAWPDDEPYGVVHRLAAKTGARGVGTFCLKWCLEQGGTVRIDTHRDNAPMLHVLAKLGFAYCGVIHIEDGSARLAFSKKIKKTSGIADT